MRIHLGLFTSERPVPAGRLRHINLCHYLGRALGEGRCTAPAESYSSYENSVGTGQMHLWLARPAHGWTP